MAIPDWCDTPELREHWRRPWRVPTDGRKARRFKRRLRAHGLLSPNFSIKEASNAGSNSSRIPDELIGRAQVQAFHMERLRHVLGDKPISVLSWYRDPETNRRVGGATSSRHLRAEACDLADPVPLAVAERIWGNHGGIGTIGSSSGPVRHVDCRGYAARWVYA